MIQLHTNPASRPYWLLPVVAALVLGLGAGSVIALRRQPTQPTAVTPIASAPVTSTPAAAPAASAAMAAVPAEKGTVSTVVLCYHRIADKPDQQTVLPAERFEAQLQWLAEQKYQVLPLRDVVKAMAEGTALPAKSVVITFDDGFLTDYKAAFPLLQKYNMPATVFVYTNWVGKAVGAVKWEQLEEMQASGLIDVESHTVNHADLVKTARRGAEQLKKELADSKAAIEEHLKKPCTIIAYPYGASNQEVREATKAAGYEAGLTVDGGAIASGDDMFRLGRRMVFRKDALQAFTTQRVAPRRLLLSEQVPAPDAQLDARPAVASAKLPSDLAQAKVFFTLDGKIVTHQLDAATGTVSAALPDNLAGRHKVGLTVVDGGLKIKTEWRFAAPSAAKPASAGDKASPKSGEKKGN